MIHCNRFTLSALTAGALLAAAGAQAQEVVKIAHAGPTSGGIAHIGKDTENGVRMAIEELNAQNLSIGGKPVKFELVAEDDGGDPKQATAVAQKLCDMKVAGVVGHLHAAQVVLVLHSRGVHRVAALGVGVPRVDGDALERCVPVG